MDSIEQIVKQAGLDSKLTEMYIKMFRALQQEQNEAFSNLENDLVKVVAGESRLPDICCALGEEETESMKMLSDIKKKNGYFFLGNMLTGFIDPAFEVRIENEDQYTGRKNGNEFSFTVKRDSYFMKIDKDIRRMNDYYHTESPVAWSPYSRRFVVIELPEDDFIKQGDVIEFGLDWLITGKTLLWNVESIKSDYVYYDNKISPYDQEKRYIIKVGNRDKNEFIIPDDGANAEISIEDTDKDRRFRLCSERKDLGFTLIKIYDCSQESGEAVFSNAIKRVDLPPERIRTKADAARAVSCLGNDKINVRYVGYQMRSDHNAEKKITKYSGEDAYCHKDEMRILDPKVVFNVGFSGDTVFLEDYANFALAYLESRYPECGWAGVRK